MNKVNKDNFKQDKYKYGFVTDIESEKIPKGLNEDVVKLISEKKEEPATEAPAEPAAEDENKSEE